MASVGKLTPRQVLDVRAMLASGQYSKVYISRLLNVTDMSINAIARGKAYGYLQTEEDLYTWHVQENQHRNFAHEPYIYTIYDAYCGFKLCSYGLRKYGRKTISTLISTIKICEHGILCEDCCFIYQGPEKANDENSRTRRFVFLPDKIVKHDNVTLMVFITEITIGYVPVDTKMTCKNYHCANMAHVTFTKKLKYGRTRQEIARNHK